MAGRWWGIALGAAATCALFVALYFAQGGGPCVGSAVPVRTLQDALTARQVALNCEHLARTLTIEIVATLLAALAIGLVAPRKPG